MFFQIANRGVNAVWAYILTLLALVVAFFIGQVPLAVAVARAADPGVFYQTLDLSSLGYDPNLILALLLLPFLTGMVVFYLLIRTLHQRPFRTVVTSRRQLDWARFLFALGVTLGISCVIDLGTYGLDPANYSFHFEWSRFVPLVLIAVLLIPVQTSLEELLFRGYLMQGIGLWAGNRWLPLLVTSVAFGLLHLGNPEIEAFSAGVMLPYYIGLGLLLGICTLMDEGTEIALGFHAANNIYGTALVSFPGSALQTETLFRMGQLDPLTSLPAFGVGGLLFLLIMARRYDWKDWRKLWKPLDLNDHRIKTKTLNID